MSEQIMESTPSARDARPFLPVLLLLFFGSGCAALIYEIVWFQMLELVIGSSAVSLGVLLGTYMGGMCLGSLLLPRMVPRERHPLRVYAFVEAGIGLCGIAVWLGVPLVDHVYAAVAGPGLAGILLRGAVSAACLLPPTLLMGASLPAIARWVETTPRGVSWLGFFYGGNIAGAVFGCLAAGFYLLRVHDMAVATYAAVAVNAAVAAISLLLAARAPHRTGTAESRLPAPAAPGSPRVYLAIALSGLCALGAEVVWTRLLALMLGATVYTFSIILAVVLLGLGIGSSAGSFLARRLSRPRIALGVCQLLLVGAIAWSAYMLAKVLPYRPFTPAHPVGPWTNLLLDLARSACALLPAALLWGASFPLALAAAAAPGQDAGRLTGRVYAANTAGAIAGSLGFSMLLIPWLGTHQSERLLIALSAVAALVVLVPLSRLSRASERPPAVPGSLRRRIAAAAALVASLGIAAALTWKTPAVPWEVVAYGRRLPARLGISKLLYLGEGMNSSVAVSEWSGGIRLFHVSGKTEASSEIQDMRVQRMLGHVPALLHSGPRSALVVGCGAGVTTGSLLLHPGMQRVVLCEIEPLVPPLADNYFAKENYGAVRDPRTQIVYDDARHYILTTHEKFDVITSDPIHPWVKGVAALYTKEYYELCKRRLNPGGVFTQWVPLYESDLATVKSEMATFFEVFPEGTIWGNDFEGVGYDVILVGHEGPAVISLEELERRLDRPDYRAVADSLHEVEFMTAVGLLSTYAGRGPDLASWLRGAPINRDRNLRLQYMAGLGFNTGQAMYIYDDMLRHRRFPTSLFATSEAGRQALRRAMGIPRAAQ